MLRIKPKVNWNNPLIAAEKARIKGELDALSSSKEKLSFAIKQVRELEKDDTSLGRLRSFIYVISALFQNSFSLVLSDSQVEDLSSRAYGILQVEGIQAGISKLAFLYGEIQQARSLAARKGGKLWQSAWEQQLGAYLSRPVPIGGGGFQALALANRSQRLGNGTMALQYFEAARHFGISSESQLLLAINEVRTLRLRGDKEEALKRIDSLTAAQKLPLNQQLEIDWEKICLTSTSDDLTQIISAVNKNKPHHIATYLIEAFFGLMPLRRWNLEVACLR